MGDFHHGVSISKCFKRYPTEVERPYSLSQLGTPGYGPMVPVTGYLSWMGGRWFKLGATSPNSTTSPVETHERSSSRAERVGVRAVFRGPTVPEGSVCLARLVMVGNILCGGCAMDMFNIVQWVPCWGKQAIQRSQYPLD